MKFFFTGPVCPAGIALSLRQRQRYRLLIFLMRVSCTYIILMVLSLQVLLASKGRGQNLDQIKVTIGLQNENLKTLFDQIELQTGLSFAFTPVDIEGAPTVSLPRATRSVKSTLDLALVGTYLRYEQVNQNVIVSKSEAGLNEGPYVAFSIRGKVTNNLGEVMPGVSIYVKGTTRGTTTDAEGIYVISAEANDVLVFSFVGFKTQEVNVDARGVIDVGMEDDAATLGEVVVKAGYYDVKKSQMTGNISRVTSEEIEKQSISNPLQAIQGRMPGVYVEQVTGLPGGAFNIKIRGTNSLRTDGNYPLYIVDGVPFTSTSISSSDVSESIVLFSNPLNNINFSDIESIEVLKDADATAIYGSRGANGVVLITTKHGQIGKTKIDINVNQGTGRLPKTLDLLNNHQWLEMRNEAFLNDGIKPTKSNAPDLISWDTTRNTDWQKVLLGGTASYTNAQTSFSGGSENTQFIFSTNYFRETTVFPSDFNFRRGTAHLNINQTSNDKRLRLNISTNYTISNNLLPSVDFTNNAITLSPVAPKIYNENGDLNWENGTWENPFGALKRVYKSQNQNLIANTVLSYEIINNFTAKVSLGYNSLQSLEKKLNPISSYNPTNKYTGSSWNSNNSDVTWIAEPQIEYAKALKNIKVSILIGSTFQETNRKLFTISGAGIRSDAQLENIKAAPSISVYTDRLIEYRYSAVFTRFNIELANKYILNATARRDGSSRFGPSKQFGTFGAIGAAWIFSNENFVKDNISFINFAKLRFSYGITGSDQIQDYQFFDTYSSTFYTYDGVSGLVPTRLANPDYSWEKNKKLETAIEFAFLENRINASVSWYRNRSSNQLVGYPLPVITGQPEIQYNLDATVQNSGTEIILESRNITTQSFKWETAINITFPKNKLISFPNLKNSSYANNYIIGKSTATALRFHELGVNPATGLYSFEDVDGNANGTDYPADLRGLKAIQQISFSGIRNTITYKNFEIDFVLQFVKQTGNSYVRSFNSPGTRASNQPTIVLSRWQQEGDLTEIQKFGIGGAATNRYGYMASSDAGITDASFLRLKTISISWQAPIKVARKMHLQNLRFQLQGQNILTITNYLGYDPETQSNRVLPPLRVLTAGLNISL